jgi:hypothetical protein
MSIIVNRLGHCRRGSGTIVRLRILAFRPGMAHDMGIMSTYSENRAVQLEV